jgi:glutathione synthase/RimK-type ligase-like ATP-grasp enzyme
VGLSTKLGYKVWRSAKQMPGRIHLLYGDQKGKIEQYHFFANEHLPALEFTESIAQAKEWAKKTPIVCRKLTHASEGKGIVIAETPEAVVPAPVYTKYRKKNYDGEADAKIRNTANGYVFCSDGVVEPDGLRALALKASTVTKSDFKGVDIGYNEKLDELFVIEVNSAPGIEGTNVDRYIEVITKHV